MKRYTLQAAIRDAVLAFIAAGHWGATATLAQPTASAPPAKLSIDDLIVGMRRIDDAFNPIKATFRIRFRQDQESLDENGQVKPELHAWVENDYARKGKLLYAHLINKLPDASAPYEEWIVWDDRICTHRRADGISIFPELLPQGYAYSRYTDGIYADCYRLIEWKTPSSLRKWGGSPSNGFVFGLPKILIENRQHYQLRPTLEQVDDGLCHVLEWPDHDLIYIDANRGFVVRRRKIWFRAGAPNSEQWNRDLFEARPGLWLPRSQEEHRYFHLHSPAHFVGKVRRISKTKLLDISFDQLPDSLFAVPMEEDEALLVNDNIRKIQYWRHPEGTDPVKAALSEAFDLHESNTGRLFLLVNAIVVGVIMLLLLVRGTKRA
jgi:hypothetical protein